MSSPCLKISDIAARSGFTTATLRYYEQIGLLPSPDRSAAGYRQYDDQTLERLEFIARAKQLGCSLDEIVELSAVRDDGVCGPVQDRLRVLVADKIASARVKIAELTALSIELERVAATLEVHRPDGACDDRCGCLTSRSAADDALPIHLVTKNTRSAVRT